MLKNLIIILIPTLLISCSANVESRMPQPKDPGIHIHEVEEGEGHKLKRLQWLNQLHRSDADVDWRQVEWSNRQERQQNQQNGYRSKQSGASDILNGQWIEKGSSNQAGRIMGAAYDTTDQSLFVMSDGGTLFRGTLDGTNWTALNDDFRFAGGSTVVVEYESTGNRRIWTNASKFIYYSDDEGMTWEEATGLNNVQSWGAIYDLKITSGTQPKLVALVLDWNYTDWNARMNIFEGEPATASFSSVLEGNFLNGSDVDLWVPNEKDTAYYAIWDSSIFRITPGVQDLDTIGSLSQTGGNYITGGCNDSLHQLHVLSDGLIYTSSDTGANWQNTGQFGNNPFRRGAFASSNEQPDDVYHGAVDTEVSRNAGVSFNKVNNWYDYYPDPVNNLHADIPEIKPIRDESGNELILISTDGGIYVSDDHLNTVRNISLHGLNVSQYYSNYTNRTDTNLIYLGSQDQGFQQSTMDSGNALAFDQLISGDYASIVSTNKGESIWYLYPGFLVYREDTGPGWSTATEDFNGRDDFWLPVLAPSPFNREQVYMAGRDASSDEPVVYLGQYNGFTGSIDLNALPNGFVNQGGGKVASIETMVGDQSVFYIACDNGTFFRSTDLGLTYEKAQFTDVPDPHYFFGSAIYAAANDSGVVYVGGSGYSNPGVFVSADSGRTFEAIDNGLPSTQVYDLIGGPGDSIIFAATHSGPYAYSTSDSTWTALMNQGAPDQEYWSVEYLEQSGVARFATYGRGVWDFRLNLPEDTSSFIPEPIVSPYALYPVPANQSLYIKGQIESESVLVELYTISGQSVMRVNVSENEALDVSGLPAGVYVVKFNGSAMGSQRFIKL